MDAPERGFRNPSEIGSMPRRYSSGETVYSTDTMARTDLVLIGGGHSHVEVLKRFGMRPLDGLRLTLITRDVMTPYSGMLPGLIAGQYSFDDSHIDLQILARFAACRIYHSEVQGLDLDRREVLCKNRPPVRFDLLSINIGSRPAAVNVPGVEAHALPVKPIDAFLTGWERLIARIAAGRGGFGIAVVGAGAGGVELLLSVQYRLRRQVPDRADALEFHLLTDTARILPYHNPSVRVRFERILRERGVRVHTGHRVTALEAGVVHCEDGRAIPADAVLWVTHAAAPAWLAASGLATDAAGFVRVDETLQSVSHSGVFAVGDIAAVEGHPRPKSGVFAVRQGPPLTNNLRRAAQGLDLKRFVPQRQYLSLIGTGGRYAVGARGPWAFDGRWVWRLKDWIDRRFMRKYTDLPRDETRSPTANLAAATSQESGEQADNQTNNNMRCGGCGAKLGSSVLMRVLERLEPVAQNGVIVGLLEPDDAAVIAAPPDQVLVQSVDYFRDFLDDPYLFGKIAANHSLGDLYAMNAVPHSALAIATVPYAPAAAVEAALYDLMRGALEVLNAAGAALVGGHSGEGAELAFGLTVTGFAERSALLRKGGLHPDERLILTKPLGTGALLAADMRRRAKGRWIEAAIESMLVPNRAAAECLARFGVSACTDVTGFGLLGHLLEMVRVSNVDARLELDALPALPGALETLAAGVASSLHPENLRSRRAIRNLDGAARHAVYPLLFDPQTAGGLLAGVAAEHAAACVAELRRMGYPSAAIIGRIAPPEDGKRPISLAWGGAH